MIEQVFIDALKSAGFIVYLAGGGRYGFFTDEKGSRVVSFQLDLGGISFSGNYKFSDPISGSSSWGICGNGDEHSGFRRIFENIPPRWAHLGKNWEFVTAREFLRKYNNSSSYIKQ